MYYSKHFSGINLNEKLDSIGELNQTFRILNKLNQILKTILPIHLSNACHIGAIDNAEEIVILYVTEQALFHVIRNFSNSILQEFAKNNFHFDKILIRNKIISKTPLTKKAPIDDTSRAKLSKIATQIGKPEIIKTSINEVQCIDDDVISL